MASMVALSPSLEGKPMSDPSPFSNSRPLRLDDFHIGHKLGAGKYGTVYVAQHKASNYVVAIKCLQKKQIFEEKVSAQVVRELEIQGNMRHPNLLRVHAAFSDAACVYIVIDYCFYGELYMLLKRMKRFPEHIAARYISSMASALQYLHSKHVMHRDIKPENILVDAFGTLKLADFGWSAHDRCERRKTACGTLDYLPAEIVRRQPYTPAVDMWSLGVLAYEFLYGEPPFLASEQRETYDRIMSASFSFPTAVTVSDEAKDLISKLLQLDASKRLTPKEVVEHPWCRTHMDALAASGDLYRAPEVFDQIVFRPPQPKSAPQGDAKMKSKQ